MPDTYTSQFSGEEIDAALRAAQIISGADTPAALREKLEIRGDTIPVSATDPTPISEALTASGGGVNPNLLDNWFFGNPVNQRGQMEYTGNGYTIDRWSSGVALSLKNGFIRITSSGMYTQIFQTLESDFAGKTFTFSLIVRGTPGAQCRTLAYDYAKDVAYGMGTTHEFVSDGFEMVTVSDTFPSNTPAKLTFILYPDNADTNLSVDILAAKLELGDTQTLAHQDSSGNWILNEIPDFGEQLRRCQRYHLGDMQRDAPGRISENNTAYCVVPIPVTMRQSSATPVQAISKYGTLTDKDGASHVVNNAYCVVEADSYLLFAVLSTETMPVGPCVWQDAHFSVSKDL